MNIRVRQTGPIRCYNIMDVENYLKTERGTYILDNTIFNCYPGILHYDDEYMNEDSMINLLQYIHKESGILMALAIREYFKQQKRSVQKRAYSSTHRIEIAYKSKYTCNMCDVLLPPTFEVDHIVELQDGGSDTYENCQALCNNCHASKTRANVLRRDDTFKKVYDQKFKDMQHDAFEKFKCKSKYF
jgi:5-methylcytosine-specific restriction endonuclease McrA